MNSKVNTSDWIKKAQSLKDENAVSNLDNNTPIENITEEDINTTSKNQTELKRKDSLINKITGINDRRSIPFKQVKIREDIHHFLMNISRINGKNLQETIHDILENFKSEYGDALIKDSIKKLKSI